MTVLAELRMVPAASARAGWDAPRGVRLVLSAAVLFTLLVGANLATPLYAGLEARLGYGSLGTSVAFASYVLTLVGVLLAAGHWSDHVGRRAAMVLAVVLGLAGAAVFAGAGSLAQLCAGRALQGAAVGLAMGACTAALRELLPHRGVWAGRVTLLASSAGVAAGPALGGLAAEAAGGPGGAAVPFVVHCGVLAALLVPLVAVRARPALLPAAGPGRARLLAPRSLRHALPDGAARRTFSLAAGVGFLSFAMFGYQLSFAPGSFAAATGLTSLPATGALAGLSLAASAASQLLAPAPRGLRAARAEVPAALAVLGVSLGALAWGTAAGSAPVLVAASLAGGLGQGVAFRSLFTRVSRLCGPASLAQTVSLLYVVTYLGSAVPVVALGAAAARVGVVPASVAFLVVCAATGVALAALAARVPSTTLQDAQAS
ncbi:MFS transporter [Sinomonas halotolerans]|uniref:MFS transporter n=1 Tax=Sinomonas halotolerans TaxID=1644133 RepID=A0ABU9X1P2_9MICC